MVAMLLCCTMAAQAQNISGRVIDQQGNAIEFANVVLLSRADSTALAGTITDSTGAFSLQATAAIEAMCLNISFVGYKPQHSCDLQPQMGTITLEQISQNIDEVLVTARKKLYRIEPNGMSARVEGTVLQQLDNATQVLDQIPFVNASEQKIEVFGKGEPLVYINNRRVYDNSEIERLLASDIESVRLITSPGPEYGAGVRAVIRITTKRTAGDGLSGNAFLRGEHGKYFSHRGQGELNYRAEKYDVFGSGGWQHNKGYSDSRLTTQNTSNSTKLDMFDEHNNHSYWAETGFNFLPTAQHSMGARYTFRNNPVGDWSSQIDSYMSGTITDTSHYTMTKNQIISDPSHRINAYYNGQLTERLGIVFNADYKNTAVGNRMSNVDQKTQIEVASLSQSQAQLYSGNLKATIKALGGEFALGGEAARTTHKQQYSIENAPIDNSTNQSDNTLMAAYASYSTSLKNMLTLELGLRYEHDRFRYLLNGVSDSANNRNYNLLTPSVSLGFNYQWLQVGLSYSQKVSKPSYYNLRNDVQYNSPFLYEGGNPYLKPTTTNSIDLQLGLAVIQLMASYEMHTNQMVYSLSAWQNDDNIIYMQPQNVDKSQSLSVMAATGLPIGPWQVMVQGGMQKQFLTYNGQTFNKPLWMAQVNNTIDLPWDMKLNANLTYQGSGNMQNIMTKSMYFVDIWLSKYFLNKQLRLNVGMYDITHGNRECWELSMGDLKITKDAKHDSRSVFVSLNYTFNKARSRYKGKNSTDELNRL